MLVLGDISGIQNYVFDVAEEGGGQAQRLRARSFFVQLLAETAALRVLRALKWPMDSVRLSGAGKFLLEGPNVADVEKYLVGEEQIIDEWLLRETRAELRLALAWADTGSEVASYLDAQRQLQRSKAQAWAPVSQGDWDHSRLLLDPLNTPCDLCHHAPAIEPEIDRENGRERQVCRTCAKNREIGRRLPQARWLVVRNTLQSADYELFGLGVTLMSDGQAPDQPEEIVAVANLRQAEECPAWCPRERFMERRLMADIPTDQHGSPVWFTELARKAQGDQLLAVLKADADSLGVRFQHLLETSGLKAIEGLSKQLDAFFAGRLRKELANNRDGRWQSIYTIFAGGDDLVMVGPWNIMVDFAGQMREWFTEAFHSHELTLSAGLALIKPKRPIKFAATEAERLLELAKSSGKDRLAAFGQVWKWQDHNVILKTAKQVVEWVNREEMQRGWLHTLLELCEARHGSTPNPLATARLAYHVARNYRRNDVRQWGENLVRRFDDLENIDIRYFPTIVRYALTATRTRGEEE